MEEAACDLSDFTTCHAAVQGRLPETWAPPATVTELFAYLQPVRGLPAAFVTLKDPARLRYRVTLSRVAVHVAGAGSAQVYVGHHWTYVQAEVVNALARRERAHLQTVLPPMTNKAIRVHMTRWGKSAKDVLTALWDPLAPPPLTPPQPDQAGVQGGAGEDSDGVEEEEEEEAEEVEVVPAAAAEDSDELADGAGWASDGVEEEEEEAGEVEVVGGYGYVAPMQVSLSVMRGYAGRVPLLALTLPIYLSRWKNWRRWWSTRQRWRGALLRSRRPAQR